MDPTIFFFSSCCLPISVRVCLALLPPRIDGTISSWLQHALAGICAPVARGALVGESPSSAKGGRYVMSCLLEEGTHGLWVAGEARTRHESGVLVIHANTGSTVHVKQHTSNTPEAATHDWALVGPPFLLHQTTHVRPQKSRNIVKQKRRHIPSPSSASIGQA